MGEVVYAITTPYKSKREIILSVHSVTIQSKVILNGKTWRSKEGRRIQG